MKKSLRKKDLQEYSLKDIEKLLKPKLFQHVFNGLITIAPYLHLFRIIIEKSYEDLLKVTIATGIALPLFTLNWAWYVYDLRHYKKDAEEIYAELQHIEK